MTAPIDLQLDPQPSRITPDARPPAREGAGSADRERDGDDATHVTVSSGSLGSAAHAVRAENVAAAASAPEDINQAADLVRRLTAQLTADPSQARAAQGNVTARNALSLLS